MSPAAVDFRSPIASQKGPSSGADSRPSSGFDFGAVFPGPGGGGGEFRRSESLAPGKSRPRLVKLRKQGGLQHPRSRTAGGGNGGFVFGADRSGVTGDASEAWKAEFVFGSRGKEESFAKATESQPGKSSNKDMSDQSEVLVFGGNCNNGSLPNAKFQSCSSETEAKKSTCPNFVFGDSWFNSKSNLDSGKEESNQNIGGTPFVFGSSSKVPTKVSEEVKPEVLEKTRVDDPSGAGFKLWGEMRKLSMSNEPEKAGISKAKLFSTSGNFLKPMRPSSVSMRTRRNHLREKSCEGHSFSTETVNGNFSSSSKLDGGVSGSSGAERFTFQAGVGVTDVLRQIRKDLGVDSTEPNVSFSYNYPSESVNFMEEKNYSASADPKTPLFNPSALRQSLFPILDKKPDVKNRSAKYKNFRDGRRKLKNLFTKKAQAQDTASKDSTLPQETNTSECDSPMDFSPYQESTSTSIQPDIHSKTPSVSNGASVAPAEPAAKFSGFCDTKSYMFSAAQVEQCGSSIRRRHRRRSRIGVGNNTFVIKPRTDINPELSSVLSSPFCQNPVDKAEAVSKIKQGNSFSATVHETCQNWRIRGNEAYKNGDLSKAETLYTQGIVSVPSNERLGNSLEPLLLCHSNRAAARMHLQRVREAIGDCETAISLDPNFLKAHSRAANCHLLLGEIEQSLQYFSKCLERGSGVCLDRKIMLDAVDGQQKAQKVAEFMAQSAKLLEEKSPDSALTSLEMISEALSISPYSEKLIKLKADALIMVRRHEEAIQLCEKSLSLAEQNFTSENASESYSLLRLWRWFLISKCYFLLGRLESALPLLDKLKQVGSIDYESARKDVQSAISLETTIRGLLQTKNAGNEAFKAGRYSEAVEHYTAALCSNFESRHFAAICFCNRAAAHRALGQITDAIADCSLAIALDGNYRKAVSRRAILLEMIRDYAEAASDLRRLISMIENQPCDMSKQSGSSGGNLKELRQAQTQLLVLEQEAKTGISLDLYLILGSKPDDTSADIKKAYRKAALKHHPDKAGQFIARSESGDEGRLWREISQEVHKDADRLFKMIGEAYAVLSDSSKRSQYDLEEDFRKTLKAENGSTTQRRQSGDQYSYGSNSYTRHDDFQESFYKRNFQEHWKTHGNSYSRWHK